MEVTIFYGGRQSGKTEKLVRALADCLSAGESCALCSRSSSATMDILRRVQELFSSEVTAFHGLVIYDTPSMMSHHITNKVCLFVDTDNSNFYHFIRHIPKKLFYTLEATE